MLVYLIHTNIQFLTALVVNSGQRGQNALHVQELNDVEMQKFWHGTRCMCPSGRLDCQLSVTF